MNFNTLTPQFRYLLDLLIVCLKKHQYISFYYDFSQVDANKTAGVKAAFTRGLSSFYNVIGFTDFVPGFLTNINGGGFPKTRSPIVFVILLNFNYRNPKHRNLLEEISFAKIEYIIISSTDIDLVRYKPYLFIKADLNNLKALEFFLFYINNYLRLNLCLPYHKLRAEVSGKFRYKILLTNYLYIISIIRNPENIIREIAIYLHTTKKKFRLRDFRRLETSIKYFILPTVIKAKFYKRVFSNIAFTESLYKNRKLIRKRLLAHYKMLIRKADKVISVYKIRKLLIKFRKAKLKFV